MRIFFPGVALFAAVACSASAASAGELTHRFTRDGDTYSYTVTRQAGEIVLTGECESTGRPFELTVRGDWISGTSGGIPVAFRMPDAQARLTASNAELAAR